MRTLLTWSMLFACAALLIVSGPVQAQTPIDSAWQKTTNQTAGDLTKLGLPASCSSCLARLGSNFGGDGGVMPPMVAARAGGIQLVAAVA